MGFHPANFGLPIGLSVLELGPGTRQTNRLTDGLRPSFYNAPLPTAFRGVIIKKAYSLDDSRLLTDSSRKSVRYWFGLLVGGRHMAPPICVLQMYCVNSRHGFVMMSYQYSCILAIIQFTVGLKVYTPEQVEIITCQQKITDNFQR